MDVTAAVASISDKTGPTDLAGSLADVYNYLYSDNDAPNEGINLAEGGTPPDDVKNYDAPRPLVLHGHLTTLLTDLTALIDLKEDTNVEANAAISALSDEVPVIDVSPITGALTAFNDLFTADDTIESVAKELEKLTTNLKKFIDEANDTKIQNVIENNTSNILQEIEKLITVAVPSAPVPHTNVTVFDGVVAAWDALVATIIDDDFGTLLDDDIAENVNRDTNNGELHGRSLAAIEQLDNSVYNQILTEIGNLPLELPPSSAMAGIYARVDSDRGVWKAPANVSLSYVIEPSVQVSHDDQRDLNVDVVAGKSINAIRAFVGKGNLVWGARTLAGNDNEWRYISVRRFFNMAEESIKKATEQFVFEPNDKNTWVRVKAMIDNFLTQQWRAGALAGPAPDKAFYVNVGLGETMTAQDILEGNMIIEIGMAVVRPAEFIILKFSHKMQEA
jgi:hypothetical protein